MSTDFGLREFNVKSKKERIKRYRRYVYEAGALNRPDKMQAQVIDAKVVAKERKFALLHSYPYLGAYFHPYREELASIPNLCRNLHI